MNEKQEKLANDILILSRNTLLVNLRFLDVALSRLTYLSVESVSLMTDGNCIYYTPMHILHSYKTAKEIPVRDYLHMVMHCVFQHMWMASALRRDVWDLACDIAVENVISDLHISVVEAPRETVQKPYLDKMRAEMPLLTAEKLYAWICRSSITPALIENLRSAFSADDHSVWYMSEDERKALGFSVDATNGSASFMEVANLAADWQKVSERMQVDLETFGKNCGLLPAALTQNLAAVNREQYDYTAFLKKFAVMGEAIKINDDEFDYIFYTYGLQLYEKVPLVEPLEYKEIKAIKEFVIAIDTSGSTSGELVQKFVQKTYNILKSTESFFSKINLHIIQCDADIQEDKKITCQEDFDEYLKTMKIRGLGGTDFRPVFEYVEQLLQNKEFTNLKGLIYFTDGYGAFPAKKPDYDTAFVFVDDEYNNPDVPPWAIKLFLQKDEI